MFGIFKKKPAAAQTQTKLPGSVEFAREVLAESFEAYKLARRDRPREHNQPHAYSGDAAIMSSHFMMNRRVRDLVRNTAQGKRVRQAFQDLIVGTGFQTFAWPFAPSEMFMLATELQKVDDGEIGPRLQYALESDDLYEEWVERPVAIRHGRPPVPHGNGADGGWRDGHHRKRPDYPLLPEELQNRPAVLPDPRA